MSGEIRVVLTQKAKFAYTFSSKLRTCYIGNKNLFTLWYLALVPHFLYFCAGGLLLTIGWIFVLKAPKLPRNSLSTPLTQGQPRTERDFLGALATLYVVPIFVVMMSYFIEYSDSVKF
ncbi:hypothetical protein D910_00712 [Dendroctonus ponderosae]|uniref:Frizzled/Smoothened 7TM domain-containing protein n=1 Tax=Dendroctonus ponderosae TaxID=77166 RepID=U4V018_DENPD|nr:hypothetical protein D910_00712 [Dendroctonus ponderosae]